MSPLPLSPHALNNLLCGYWMKQTLIFFFSDQLKMNKDLTKARDQLLTTVEDLREKLNKAITTQQEIETQRDAAFEDISQVMWHRRKQKPDG